MKTFCSHHQASEVRIMGGEKFKLLVQVSKKISGKISSLGVLLQIIISTLEVLPLCHLRVSGSYIFHPIMSFYLVGSLLVICLGVLWEYSQRVYLWYVGVIYQIHMISQSQSQYNILESLGVLPLVLYYFCGSTPAKVV